MCTFFPLNENQNRSRFVLSILVICACVWYVCVTSSCLSQQFSILMYVLDDK